MAILRVWTSALDIACWRIPSTKRESQKDALIEFAPLRDRVQISVLAVCVDDASRTDGHCVRAPFEPVGMIRNAAYGCVGELHAALRVRAPELPRIVALPE